MKQVAVLMALVILAAPVAAWAQGCPDLRTTLGTTNPVVGIDVEGDFAYLGLHGFGLQVIDISNPESPVARGSYATYVVWDLTVVGNYAYLADWSSCLIIVDISDPDVPTWVATYTPPSYPSAISIDVDGDHAYLGDYYGGFFVVDVSNPASPQPRGTLGTLTEPWGIDAVGSYAYVADGSSGLRVIDVSDPDAVTITATFNTSGSAFGVVVEDNKAWVADYNFGLMIADVSSPSAPVEAGTWYPANGGKIQGINKLGNVVYLPEYSPGGMHVVDVSNVASPLSLGYAATSDSGRKVDFSGLYAFMAVDDGGMAVLEIGACQGEIFSDSFESGNTTAWTATVP